MDSNTGEMREFDDLERVPVDWTLLEKGEVVIVKDCCFKLLEVNIPNQTITLKAISKKEAIESL